MSRRRRVRQRVRQIRGVPGGSHPIQSGVRVQYPLDVCVSTSCTASFDIRNPQDRDSQEPPSRLLSCACRRWNEPPPDHGASGCADDGRRSEEHTSELQSLMLISYAVFCLKKKKYTIIN